MDGFSSLRVEFVSPGGAKSTHTIYCKLHHVRQNSELTPNDRTLFSIGWPPYCSEEAAGELFSRTGHVEKTFLQLNPGTVDVEMAADSARNPRGFQVGYVVMSSANEAKAALQMCEADTVLPCQLSNVGLKRWSLEYARERCSVATLERRAVGVVSSYDLQQDVERQKKRRAGEPDEEGWITVTRKRRANQTQDGKGRKKRKKELVNLYPWQQRETQRQQIAELRRKFEEDKKRVAEMKSRRKFKPF